MKYIWIFTHDFYPIKWWQWTHIYNIYNKLLDINFNNFIVFSPLKNKLKKHKTIFPETKQSKFQNISMSLKLFLNFRKIIKENDLNMIHLHWGPWWLFLFQKLHIPVLFTCHHTYWQQYKYMKWQKWKIIFYYFEKLSYKQADKVICVSQDTKTILQEKYNIDENKLVYIPNGIDIQDFRWNEQVKKEKNSLVFVWRLDTRKWIDFLVESMIWIIKENHHIKLYIIWEWKLREKLENFIKIHTLQENIIFCWKLLWDDFKQRIQKSEIMIIPSVFEWFWISILEAMALKVPVIATNVDGIRTIIHNWENWILINYGDKVGLKNKVIELIHNKKLQEKYIENAHRDLDKKYNRRSITQKTLNQYELLNSKYNQWKFY